MQAVKSLMFIFISLCVNQVCLAQATTTDNIWFTSLDSAMISPLKVTKLDLSNTGLTELPIELSEFLNLEKLNLSDNNISNLGDGLSANSKLISIDLSQNQIESIDFNQFKKSSLKLQIFLLRENMLTEIGPDLNALPFLNTLDLGANFIESISDSIILKYLKKFSLDNNLLMDLPTMVFQSPKLKILDLSTNHIEEIDVRNFSSLIILDVSDNPLKKFNITVSKLRKISFDRVDMNNVELLPLPKSLEGISLDFCKLDSIPTFVLTLFNLKELSLKNNSIEQLDSQLSSLAKLKTVWIGNNKLSEETALKIEESNFNFKIVK